MKPLKVSNSFRDFLEKSRTKNKIAKILLIAINSHEKWGERMLGRFAASPRVANLMVTTEEVNYLTLRKNGTISFLPAGRELVYTAEGTWSREGRQEGKPSRVIRKLFTKKMLERFSEQDFEMFTNLYKANATNDDEGNSEDGTWWELRTDISRIYDEETVVAECFRTGSLGESCMNGESRLTEFYDAVPGLKILTLWEKAVDNDGYTVDRLLGRALVWTTVTVESSMLFQTKTNQTVMDRVYAIDDVTAVKFAEYADAKKWWRKPIKRLQSKDSYESFLRIDITGEEAANVEMDVEVPLDKFSEFPYLDTFFYVNNDNRLSNYNNNWFAYLRSTNGEVTINGKFTTGGDSERSLLAFKDVYGGLERETTLSFNNLFVETNRGEVLVRDHTIIFDGTRYSANHCTWIDSVEQFIPNHLLVRNATNNEFMLQRDALLSFYDKNLGVPLDEFNYLEIDGEIVIVNWHEIRSYIRRSRSMIVFDAPPPRVTYNNDTAFAQ